ncbi:MAG TPA: hypothetical protein VJV23_02180 [Candidatus Polarisedimenticolia bacterium]|nr:hypothetical protein [Candidatus Polarisedimenticolia bacterium]
MTIRAGTSSRGAPARGASGRKGSGGAQHPAPPGSVSSLRYSAAVLGDGRVLPIHETLGRRHLRDIEPLSAEGRRLLSAGRVTLWYEDGSRAEAAPIRDVLDRIASRAAERRGDYPQVQAWTDHHDRVLRSIGRMKKVMKRGH